MGFFDDARELIKAGKTTMTDMDGSTPATLIMWANMHGQTLTAGEVGVDPELEDMLTTNPNLLRYLEKLETNTLSGWKKDTDGKTYSKFFVAAHQRGLVQTVLAFLAQAEGGVMPTLSQLVRDDEAGDMIQGQQTIKYKLTVDAAILEPILKREGMTLDGTGKSGV